MVGWLRVDLNKGLTCGERWWEGSKSESLYSPNFSASTLVPVTTFFLSLGPLSSPPHQFPAQPSPPPTLSYHVPPLPTACLRVKAKAVAIAHSTRFPIGLLAALKLTRLSLTSEPLHPQMSHSSLYRLFTSLPRRHLLRGALL